MTELITLSATNLKKKQTQIFSLITMNATLKAFKIRVSELVGHEGSRTEAVAWGFELWSPPL
jgi:hypothetical protein